MNLEAGDVAFLCGRCDDLIEAGHDILTDDDVRVGLCCWHETDGWQSAGSIVGRTLTHIPESEAGGEA